MPEKPDTVDQYLSIGCGRCELGGTPQCKVHSWQNELNILRSIVQVSGLREEIKWSAPCYTNRGKNIVMVSALKESVVLSFFEGAQLKDPDGILEKPGKNSRFARYIRFNDIETIHAYEASILSYIQEAIALAERGGVTKDATQGLEDYPDELIQVFSDDSDFENAFLSLTPGRQRGYLIHFSSAKQSKTRTTRILKSKEKIYAGKGWNER